jgi:hypothetical protein
MMGHSPGTAYPVLQVLKPARNLINSLRFLALDVVGNRVKEDVISNYSYLLRSICPQDGKYSMFA